MNDHASRFGGGWDGMGGFSIGFAVGCGFVGILFGCVMFGLNIENKGLRNKLAELEAENVAIAGSTACGTNRAVSFGVYQKVLAGEVVGDEAEDEAKDEAKDEANYFGWYTCDLTFDCTCPKCQRERAIDNTIESTERINRNIDEITNLIDKIMCNLDVSTNKLENSK